MRSYLEELCYDKSMVSEAWLDYQLPIAKQWWDLYMKAGIKSDDYWKKTSSEAYYEQYFVDGVHIRERVHEIKTPSLLIWGRQSNKGVDGGYELYMKMTGASAQFHIFDQAKHFLWLDQPEAFESLVSWYLGLGQEVEAGAL